jgi:hypothetical protein
VVDVAHDGDDGRTRRCRMRDRLGDVEQAFLDVGCGNALDGVAEFFGDQLRGVGVDHIGDLVHRALLHQQADDVDRALRHAVGEFLNRDRFRNRHFADELFLRLVGSMALEALGAAAERSDERSRTSSALSAVTMRQAAALLRWTGFRSRLRRNDGAQPSQRVRCACWLRVRRGPWLLLQRDGVLPRPSCGLRRLRAPAVP